MIRVFKVNKPDPILLHLHVSMYLPVYRALLFSSILHHFYVCASVFVSRWFSGVLERNASGESWANSEPHINNWGGQEAREWLLQYSYVILTWLPATRPCAQYLWSLTDDWGCNAMSSSSFLLQLPFLPSTQLLILHLYATSSFSSPSLCHAPTCPLLLPSTTSFHPPSSAAISQKSVACPWAKFNYRPN